MSQVSFPGLISVTVLTSAVKAVDRSLLVLPEPEDESHSVPRDVAGHVAGQGHRAVHHRADLRHLGVGGLVLALRGEDRWHEEKDNLSGGHHVWCWSLAHVVSHSVSLPVSALRTQLRWEVATAETITRRAAPAPRDCPAPFQCESSLLSVSEISKLTRIFHTFFLSVLSESPPICVRHQIVSQCLVNVHDIRFRLVTQESI